MLDVTYMLLQTCYGIAIPYFYPKRYRNRQEKHVSIEDSCDLSYTVWNSSKPMLNVLEKTASWHFDKSCIADHLGDALLAVLRSAKT